MKRIIILTICISMLLTLTSCGTFLYQWEFDTHKEFVEKIEKYNSINDGFVNTFISFDLDSNSEITKRIYSFLTEVSNKRIAQKYGVYDINADYFRVSLVFYLQSNINDEKFNGLAYKIRCEYAPVKYNFSDCDKIEIKPTEIVNCISIKRDMYYQESLSQEYDYRKEENKIYVQSYHFDILVNEKKYGCVHISAIDNSDDTKIEEIRQMLMDSLVILNTGDKK